MFFIQGNVDFITSDPDPGMPDRTTTDGKLNTQSIEWKALFNANLYSKFSLLRAQPTYNVEVGRNLNFEIDAATLGVREDLTWALHPNHEFKTGFELTQTTFETSGNVPLDPSEIDPTDISVQLTSYDFSEETWSGGGYLQDSWELLPALTLTGGGRFDYLSLNEKIDLLPGSPSTMNWVQKPPARCLGVLLSISEFAGHRQRAWTSISDGDSLYRWN